MEATTMISASKSLICYFSLGFAMLLIVITYFMMKAELSKEAPRNMVLQTIWVFMVLTLITTFITGIYAVSISNKNIELQLQNIKNDQEIEDLMIQISVLADMVKNADKGSSTLTQNSLDTGTGMSFNYLERNEMVTRHYPLQSKIKANAWKKNRGFQ